MEWNLICSILSSIAKLDGDARGGGALSVREVTGKPIKFGHDNAVKVYALGEGADNIDDILDDGPVDAATPRLADEFKRPLLFARKDLHVDGERDPDPAQVREIACLPTGFEREIPRVPARGPDLSRHQRGDPSGRRGAGA